MNSHDILLTIQYISVSVLFIEILIVFSKWKNPLHSYLLLTCITTFISNMGYLLEMKAGSEEAYITALKFSYVGRVWIVFTFLLFSANLCRVKIPKSVVLFFVAVHLAIFASVMSIGQTDLYYTQYQFVPDPEFPKFYHANGNMHDLLMALNVLFMTFAMVWVVKRFREEKNKTSKRRLIMPMLSFGVQILFFVLHITGIFGFTKYYDLTMPGTLLGTVFMLIGILGFDLLGTREIAKDFAIDRISEGIIAVDNDGRIQYYNEPATKIYPQFNVFFSDRTLSAKKDLLKHKTDAPEKKENVSQKVLTPYDIMDSITEAVNTGETITVGDRIYTPEENDLLYEGESYGKLYALVDDTEHFRYMEELEKQKDIADSANEAKSRFLASMSHEIRTPINAVLGMDEMILRESTEKTIRAYAADIMSAGRTLLSLINDILDLSKVEEGKMEIIPVQYDLSLLINDLVNMIRDRAAKKGLKLNVNADEHLPRILNGDEIRVRQCVMNLLTNAVKYTEAGEVTLDITYDKKDEDHIMLCFVVKDTGIGMKEEDMENLFSPYKRIEEKRNRSIEGTGLGMSITRQLLDLMGSTLKVHSEYGRGSEFSFSVEQAVIKWDVIGSNVISGMSERTHEYHELFHAPGARILVIDDTEMNLTVIQSLLKRTCIGIDTALSGRDGIALATEHYYDVIFIDHMMPDMDGIETLGHIRKDTKNKDVPAVALTANAVSGAREMYLDAGFTDYLSKPVDGEKLEQLIFGMLPEEKREVSEKDTDKGEGSDISGTDSGLEFLTRLGDSGVIDVQTGIKNCGSGDGYISVLSVFRQTAGVKADEIENLYKNKDFANYTIKVHALKSSARIIGAKDLSERARLLEEAGKSGDTEYIRQNTDGLLDMYRELNDRLSLLDKPKETLSEIDEKTLKEAYQTIAEIAGSMDYGMMEEILKDLRGHDLPESDRDRISKIEALLNELDWEGIIKTAGVGV